jgi:alpha-glucosidase
LGDEVTVFARVPRCSDVGAVWVRAVVDGEPRYTEAVVDRTTPHEQWWRAEITVHNPDTPYRFALEGGPHGYSWLTAAGVVHHDVPDTTDFRLIAHPPPPAWLADRVAYQIFPDRFASSGRERSWPSWALPARWDDPLRRGREAGRQLFGGDLPGIVAHLDHLERLGVDLVYLTPFFPAQSSHRYNASTFDHVDPLLGGDDALCSLVDDCHRRGIRVLGDITLNHSGDTHTWFRAACADPSAAEHSFYVFHRHPDEYEAWLGFASLPKFDLRDAELRRRLIDGPTSVIGRYVSPPFGLDGWRVDVANMAGRLGGVDVSQELARQVRATMTALRPDLYLVAEHCHDAHADLVGDGWHGTMNYAAFAAPVWRWLVGDDTGSLRFATPIGIRRLGGELVARTLRELAATMPWRSLASSLTLLDSHDTARFRTIAGSRDRALVGWGLMLTWPGVPMLFAGDEVGVEGIDSPDARKPFPWDESRWDGELLDALTALVALRKQSHALRHGGLRWVHVGHDVLVFVRESQRERLLVQVARAPHDPVRLPAGLLLDGGTPRAMYGDLDLDLDLHSGDDACTLPHDGPAVRVWRIEH